MALKPKILFRLSSFLSPDETLYTIISRPKKSRTGGCDLMLSITECKKILNRKGINYTNEEVEILRETLYKIAEIVHSKKN